MRIYRFEYYRILSKSIKIPIKSKIRITLYLTNKLSYSVRPIKSKINIKKRRGLLRVLTDSTHPTQNDQINSVIHQGFHDFFLD